MAIAKISLHFILKHNDIEIPIYWNSRSIHRRCSIKNGVIKNFAKFTREHLRVTASGIQRL